MTLNDQQVRELAVKLSNDLLGTVSDTVINAEYLTLDQRERLMENLIDNLRSKSP